MKILEIKAMRGPNYWSVRRYKLIVMRLDLEEMDHLPTNKIRGFYGRIKKMLPGLHQHRCSLGELGGFFKRVKKGTWMGHVIEHIALEIQTLAGMDCGFGRTRSTGEKGIYNVVFTYMEEKAGLYAAKASVRIAEALKEGIEYNLENDIQTMREIREEERLGPSTGSIVQEAISRNIPIIRMNNQSFVQLGYGINQKRIRATITSQTSDIAVEIACDKEETKDLLKKANIPIAKGEIITTKNELKSSVKYLGYPLVTKPVNGHQGKGATINITNWDDAMKGFNAARYYSKRVIIEKYVTGFDFRLLVINYKFIASALRTPAHVVGDEKSTIQQLIDKVNKDPRRGYGHEKTLTEIKVDEMTNNILNIAGLTLNSVLPKGERLFLKTTANLSTGGTATDVTDTVHPYNVFMAERIAKIIDLDICGIDIMAPDIAIPIIENGGAVLEVNAAPGFRMHLDPTDGLPRNVAEPVIDMLYPKGIDATIPIIAVTGTNGKTTTTRLVAHILKTVGYKVGFTTTDGIYIQNRMLEEGDCSGPRSVEFVLKDPTVDFAVLECARGGILRSGLGFLRCDTAIVTNIASADHLGLKDIHTPEEMAKVKAIVPETVRNDGYAILNADDILVYNMAKTLDCKIAFFSMTENNPRIRKHCNDGGLAIIIENGYVTICKGNWKIRVDKVVNIPLTFSGKAVFNIQNILPAVLAGFVRNIKIEDIRVALETFIPSPAQTPGRMNLFQFKEFEVLVDYAHNAEGFKALGKFLEKIETSPKIGIIAGVGDRRDEDLIELGSLAAQMFDEIIIRSDKNLRGRPKQELVDLLVEGYNSQKKGKPWKAISDEMEAIKYAITNAPKGSINVICSDTVPDVLNMVKKFKEEEDKFKLTKADIS